MMKKVLSLFAVLVCLPLAAHAGSDRVGVWDAGVTIQGDFLSDDNAGDNVYYGGNFSYGINSWFAVGMSAGWSDSTFDVASPSGNFAKGGRVTIVPVFADFIFRVPGSEDKNLVPYGVMGLGALFTNLHGTGDAGRFGQQADNEDGFAFKLGVGVDWFANKNWIYNLETGYVFTTASLDITDSRGGDAGSVDLDYYYLGGGVKWIG